MNYTDPRWRIAAEVRAEMARQKIGLPALSSKTGITLSTLRRRADAKTPFTIDELDLVAQALGTTLSALVSAASLTPGITA